MPEFMTIEECRRQQHGCSAEVYKRIDSLQDAVHRTEILVARIAGHLGINGSPQPHPHKREAEQEEHLHRRAEDVIAAAERIVSAQEQPREGTVTLPKWLVLVSLGVLAVIVVLSIYAGERALTPLGSVAKEAPKLLVP